MVNKEKIICDLTERTGFKKSQSKAFIEAFTDMMREYLIAGETVKIRNLFIAEIKDCNRSAARNPKTNERLEIPPCKKIRIKPSKNLNKELNEQFNNSDITR